MKCKAFKAAIRFDPYRLLGDTSPWELANGFPRTLQIMPTTTRDRKPVTWNEVVELCLGEELFGNHRYDLGYLKHLYYYLKPLLPSWIIYRARRHYQGHQERQFPLNWPIEDRFVKFFWQCIYKVKSGDRFSMWPYGKQYAFVITHDVETEQGISLVRNLADVDCRYGFRSSFNLVPERYWIDPMLREELTVRGFEVGVHGLNHDGRLFLDRGVFDKRAVKINEYLRQWNAVGFRSPMTHRNPGWMQVVDIEWDSSFFDTDPYEPMPGGTMTIWPFFIGHFVELPYTLPQDYTLFSILGETTIDIWKRKVDWIAENQGMVLVNVHPDYIDFDSPQGSLKKTQSKGKYPLKLYLDLLDYVKSKGNYWHALPKEVARWWRSVDPPFEI